MFEVGNRGGSPREVLDAIAFDGLSECCKTGLLFAHGYLVKNDGPLPSLSILSKRYIVAYFMINPKFWLPGQISIVDKQVHVQKYDINTLDYSHHVL